MAVNYLHIWPRQTFMMIALPNQVENKLMALADNPYLNLDYSGYCKNLNQ